MAEIQPTTEAERRHDTGVHSHDGVEVFDTASSSKGSQDAMGSIGQRSSDLSHHDIAFNSANLPRGARPAADFRTTDLNDSELSNSNRTVSNTAHGVADQGTSWGTILMVVAVVVVIVLVVSWIL